MISFPGGAEENKGIDVLGGVYDGMCDSGRAVSHIPHGARVLKAEYDLGDGVCRTLQTVCRWPCGAREFTTVGAPMGTPPRWHTCGAALGKWCARDHSKPRVVVLVQPARC